MKKGLLLINLGTPNQPDIHSVRRYLREFLADKRVLTLPSPLRYALLYGLILPFRSKQTAQAYQHIWTPNGSPLLCNSLSLQKKIQREIKDEYTVALGMRYGEPSIATALMTLASCDTITVLPLYPQYSSAASGSAIKSVMAYFMNKAAIPSLHIIRDFYNHPDFIEAYATHIEPYLEHHDYILFSYHGLPAHHLTQQGCPSLCQSTCPATDTIETTCYRAQCFQTTRSITNRLQIDTARHATSFQSRLGKTLWIKPYTVQMLVELAEKGVKRLAIACPSFVVDCLETLEEIGIRAKQQWLALGGESLTLIPCLNNNEPWVKAVVNIIQQ